MILTSLLLASTLTAQPLHDPFGVAWGFLYGYSGVPAPVYMPELRKLGGSWSKIYVIWNQIEPSPGKYDWKSIDTFVKQLRSPEEGLISVFSASTWATRASAAILPPSPAKKPADYDRFIRELVKHCRGRVRYWQNDSEASNPIYWSGTASEFVDETKVFYRAVKESDPKAQVVLGGYDGLFNPTGTPFPGQQRGLTFFDEVLRNAKDSFDIFDLRLYANAYTIPDRVEYMRKKMADLGYEKSIVCTEYNGPGFFDMADNRPFIPLVMAWSTSIANQAKAVGGGEGVAGLYQRTDLSPQTQMFLMNAPPALDEKLRRMQCRDLVQRNMLALSAGVQRTMFWDLSHDTSKRDDVMTLMYGKLKMFDFEDGRFTKRYPMAEAFARMTRALRGIRSVRRIPVEESPAIYLFEADCGRRGPVYVAWRKGDPFKDEEAQSPFTFPWTGKSASGVDALGKKVMAEVAGGRVSFPLTLTPTFISER